MGELTRRRWGRTWWWELWKVSACLMVGLALLVVVRYATTFLGDVPAPAATSQETVNATVEQRLKWLEDSARASTEERREVIYLLIGNLAAAVGSIGTYLLVNRSERRNPRSGPAP